MGSYFFPEVKKPKQSKLKLKSTFLPGIWIPIVNPCVNVGLGWDFYPEKDFDLDASVTGFDEFNEVIESIYYGHQIGFGGAVRHHGNNLTGEGEGDNEVITINLNALPQKVTSLAIAINSYKRNSIIKRKKGFIRLYDNKTKEEIGIFVLNEKKDCIGLLLGLFERKLNVKGWFFRVMIDPIEGNVVVKSFDSIKTLILKYSPSLERQANPCQLKHPYEGETVFVPGSWFEIQSELTYVGLGWDIFPGQIYDLDASIMTFRNNELIDVVNYNNTISQDKAIIHNDYNKTEIGEGDDEIMTINFLEINPSIDALAVLVNSFKGNNMSSVKTGFIRLFTSHGPIGCHILGQGKENLGLLLGVFRKDPFNPRWLFQVIVEPIHGTIATDCAQQVKKLLEKYELPS